MPFEAGRRVAIVTGGAGGIGAAISQRLAETGHAVIVAEASTEAAEKVAASLHFAGVAHHGFGGDLATSAANRALADLSRRVGTLSVIVNAIGISPKKDGRKISFFEIDDETWDRVMAVNLRAPFMLVREAWEQMPRDGTASIVNILSITSRLGAGGPPGATYFPNFPSSAVYAASKGGLQNLTSSLARELVGHRIRVNGVAPGFVSTPMVKVVGEPALQPMIDQVPMARMAEPSEIADAVEFLIGPKSSYITGASLEVNGGLLTC